MEHRPAKCTGQRPIVNRQLGLTGELVDVGTRGADYSNSVVNSFRVHIRYRRAEVLSAKFMFSTAAWIMALGTILRLS